MYLSLFVSLHWLDFFYLFIFNLLLLFAFHKQQHLCSYDPPHFIVPQVFGITSLCSLMNACTAAECVRGRVVHMRVWCWPAREQCVMTPAERRCVKRCNVCERRRCQHHGPLSWPGFLTQRFLSQLIGPDTNFLAELQCGRSKLIATTPLHPPPGSSFNYPTARQSHLNSRRPPVDVFFQHHF